METDELRMELKFQAQEAARQMEIAEILKEEEEIARRQREHDEQRLQAAEDLDSYYNALKTAEIREIKERERLTEMMAKDRAEFEQTMAELDDKPVVPPDDDSGADSGLELGFNVVEVDEDDDKAREQRELEEQEEERKRQEQEELLMKERLRMAAEEEEELKNEEERQARLAAAMMDANDGR